jgi:hypothetical protein
MDRSRSFVVDTGVHRRRMVFAVTQAIIISILKLPHQYASLLLGGTGFG